MLFLAKHSKLAPANATREWSKVNDGVNPAEFFGLLQVVRYVDDTKNCGLTLETSNDKSKPWEIVCFSNVNYMGDPISKRIISGIIYMPLMY